jgi:large subunit ribosomal protein L43
MSRHGVWELRELLIRYSPDGGSSRGIRDFVEQDLVRFARSNPQIKITTSFRHSHPFVLGQYGAFFCFSYATPKPVVSFLN